MTTTQETGFLQSSWLMPEQSKPINRKCFVDVRKPDGEEIEGLILYPQGVAHAYAARLRLDHPDWIVDVVPLDAVKTSYYQNKKLNPDMHMVVQTSVGRARWGAQPEWESETITPPESILGLEQMPYTRAYVKHLEKIGVPAIRAELMQLAKEADKTKRVVVLCCFEALKKPGQFCHRRIFAWWWHKQTGQMIEEL